MSGFLPERTVLIRPARRIAAALFLAAVLPAFPNPFYGAPEGETPAPAASVVRPGPFVDAQDGQKRNLAESFERLGADSSPGSWAALLGAAFLYGVLHAAGPGHRKTVVFSLFLGRKARAWEPLAAGFLSAGIHAASGGAVLLALSLIRGVLASFVQTERLILWMEGLTLAALGALGVFLLAGALRRLVRGESHEHGSGGTGLYSMLALSSLVPCPGAVLVLIFALYRGALLAGLAAFLAMSLGMGIVISGAAYLAWFGRTGFFSALKSRERQLARVSAALEAASYALILAFALVSAWPFLASLRNLI
jgi:ABC-type nickel/cobalt efflux system permease component RcnA